VPFLIFDRSENKECRVQWILLYLSIVQLTKHIFLKLISKDKQQNSLKIVSFEKDVMDLSWRHS